MACAGAQVPELLWTNFENRGLISDSPINPYLYFQFSESITWYTTAGYSSTSTFELISEDGAHVINLAFNDATQVTHDLDRGRIEVKILTEMLRPATMYNVTFPADMFRDTYFSFLSFFLFGGFWW